MAIFTAGGPRFRDLGLRDALFSAHGCPPGFYFHDARVSGSVVPEAGPLPVFELLNEASRYRVAMHVLEFLDVFCVGHPTLVTMRLCQGWGTRQ